MKHGSFTVALVATLALTGCAPQGDEDPVPTPTATRTVVTKTAVPLPKLPHRAVTWPAPAVSAHGNTIQVGTQTYDVAPMRADEAVSTRGGVYFLSSGEVWFLDRHGARGTGFARVRHLVVSADGRHLGLVDRNHGPVTAGGTQVATAVAYDTTTGRAILHSRVGMRTDGGLRRAYRADPPAAIAIADGALLATTPNGVYVYPLSGAAPHARDGE